MTENFKTRPRMFIFLRKFLAEHWKESDFSAEEVLKNMPDEERYYDFKDNSNYVRQHLDSLADSHFLIKEDQKYRVA